MKKTGFIFILTVLVSIVLFQPIRAYSISNSNVDIARFIDEFRNYFQQMDSEKLANMYAQKIKIGSIIYSKQDLLKAYNLLFAAKKGKTTLKIEISGGQNSFKFNNASKVSGFSDFLIQTDTEGKIQKYKTRFNWVLTMLNNTNKWLIEETDNISLFPPPDISLLLDSQIRDIYFDMDSYQLNTAAKQDIAEDSDRLKIIFAQYPDAIVILEGYTDNRRDSQTSIRLGELRINTVKDYFISSGIPIYYFRSLSFGKERPFCTEDNNDCWQKNNCVRFASGG